MEQTMALNALEQYLALAKSASTPSMASQVIKQATENPNTYVFAELLQMPNIQALRDSEQHKGWLQLLEIFAWGTWEEYHSMKPISQEASSSSSSSRKRKRKRKTIPSKNTVELTYDSSALATPAGQLPELSPAQERKLRLLTLLPLASSHNTLTYPSLLQSLTLPAVLDLEQLLTTALYIPLITGHLDPLHQRIHITSVAPLRDLSPGSIPSLQTALSEWEQRCTSALSELERQADEVRARAMERNEVKRLREKQVKVNLDKAMSLQSADEGGKTGGKRLIGHDDDEDEGMDMDEGDGKTSGGGRKGLRSKGGGEKRGLLGGTGRK